MIKEYSLIKGYWSLWAEFRIVRLMVKGFVLGFRLSWEFPKIGDLNLVP